MEPLGRGVIACRTDSNSVYVSWRMLGSDDSSITFNLYRTIGGGTPVRLNTSPLTATTDFQDQPGSATLNANTVAYFVRPVIDLVEQSPSAPWSLPAASPVSRAFELPFTSDPGPEGPYDTKFAWVGDFDGDGEYDFLCDRLSTLGANEQFLEAYLRDGTFLWRMHMGPTSADQSDIYRPGAAAISTGDGDNVTCFDLDGDHRAEAIVRTANGVTVTNPSGETVASITSTSPSQQFLTVIDGLTGQAMHSAPVPNAWIEHGTLQSKCFIAYLDGQHPSVILYGYNRAANGRFYRQWTAWDWVDQQLVQRWTWAQDPSTQPGAEGHQIRIADVDNDGRDELIDIGHVLDDDGTQLYVTELTHGDRFHVADINPLWPGLETYAIQQNNPSFLATAYLDSAHGGFYQKLYTTGIIDVGRGLTADLLPDHLGLEMFSTQPNLYGARGEVLLTQHPFPYEGLWWDGDTGREFIAGANGAGTSPIIDKLNPATGSNSRLLSIYNDGVHNAYGGRPAFWGDILGDWREELVLVKNDYSGLRIYTTTTPAEDRRRTLMHNAQYRVQTTTKGYVQASYVDYYLGFETTEDPPPPINDTDRTWNLEPVLNASICPAGKSLLFGPSQSATLPLSEDLSPSRIKVFSPDSFTFDGSPGNFTGPMTLSKSGRGNLTLTGNPSYTGQTEVWDGALIVDGHLTQSPVIIHGGTWGGPLAHGVTGGRLGGRGRIEAPVTLAWRGTLSPGAGNGDPAILQLANGLSCGPDTAWSMDLASEGPSDLIAITGDLLVEGTTTLLIHPLSSDALPPGTYPLATVTGTLIGSLDNFQVSLPTGTPYQLSFTAGTLQLTIPNTRDPDQLVWQGGLNQNVWDLFQTPNFLLNEQPQTFVAADSLLFDDRGAPNLTVALHGELPPSSITVESAHNYTFIGDGILSGSCSLTQNGPGTLSLLGNHTFTGDVRVNGGILAVSSLSQAGEPSAIGAASAEPEHLQLDGGTLRLDGPPSATSRGILLGPAGGTLSTPAASLQISGTLEGPGALTKTGAGLLILGHANDYTGGTILEQGTLQLASDTANASGLGSGSVTFRGGTLAMTNDTGSYNSASYRLIVPEGEIGRLLADGRCDLGGTLTGTGEFTFYTPFVRTDLEANWSNFEGHLRVESDADGGDFRIDNPYGYGGAHLDLGPEVWAYYLSGMSSNLTLNLGALSGDVSSHLQGGPTSGRTLTWRIGNRNLDTEFAGSISDGTSTTALTKIGTGIQTFSGELTYQGETLVSTGTLRLDGTSTQSSFTVQSAAALGGSGTLTGSVTLQNGSILELSTSPLAIVGNLISTGTQIIRPRLDPGIGTHIVATYTGIFSGTPHFEWAGPPTYEASFSASNGEIRVTLAAANSDLDDDLLPDNWELTYYPSLSSAAPLDDTDGDGFNTWEEWKSGTNPTLASSQPGQPIPGALDLEPAADTFIFHDFGGGTSDTTAYGNSPELDLVQWNDLHAFAYVRFDLSALPDGAQMDGVTLTFTKVTNTNEGVPSVRNDSLTTGRFGVWGLLDVDGNTPQTWDENGLTSSTLGSERISNTNPQLDTALPRTWSFDDMGESVSGTSEGATASVHDAGGGTLTSFLQARLQAASDPHLATFIVDFPENRTSVRGFALGSREATSESRPLLHLDYHSSAPIPDPDEDADTLPDAWEAQYFGSLDPLPDDDADHDGTPEWLERGLHLHPKDPAEFFAARLVLTTSGQADLSWPQGDGIAFTVEVSTRLTGPWTPLETLQGDDSASPLRYPISLFGEARFFRIVAERP
nr:autotransporter-associated beta strand repeat-containing protein [Haloferula luteola]